MASAKLGGYRDPTVVLYTCEQKTAGPGLMHPCAKAGKALDAAGYEYEIRTVKGYRLMFWAWGRREEQRAEVRRLSGSDEAPILVLDDGEVVSGSGAIATWARQHPAARAGS